MKIKAKDKTITDKQEIKVFLEKYGLYAEFWQPETTDKSTSEPLIRYKNQIEKLKKKFGYSSADVCAMSHETANLDKMLNAFVKEHHHTDDEVRFTVEGEGIFGVNPLTDPLFEVYVQPGDLLVVPANTRHWFNLTDKKNICCIRIFKENPKWEAVYEMPKEHIIS
ncbi:MAG: cupin domain-containing protein [Candidatus Melainabacteria bacterium]|nr:cupin domain-containing protein [Candidatus Melainabacteria bacterium]